MPAPALREVQRAFWSALHTGETDRALADVVPPTPTLAPAERIAVYQTMYFWRLHEVLREDYPKTSEVLGDEFEGLARRYLVRHPSEHPSVRHLGRYVPDFLETDAAVRERPWLADLARLELARVDAFDAPDAVPVRATDLSALAPDAWATLRFVPVAALQLLRSAWPIHEVWSRPDTSRVERRPTVLRVWRQEFAVFHAAVDPLEEAALGALIAGRPFADVCEAVALHVDPEAAPAEAGALLARWIEDGLLGAPGV